MEVSKYLVRISWPDPSLTDWGRRDGRDIPIFIPISTDFPDLAEDFRAAFHDGFDFLGRHDRSPFGLGCKRSAALHPCPSARRG
jgi:hypothetical protein